MEFFEKYTLAFWTFVGVFLIGIVIIAFVNTDDFMTEPVERKVEIEQMSLQGYRDGQPTWQLQAKYAWSSFSLDHPIVEHIYNGKLYDSGRLVLQDLTARIINVNVAQERLFADRGVRATLVRQAEGTTRNVQIWAEQLQYFSADKRSYVQRMVHIADGENIIDGVNALIDHTKNTVTFNKDWVLRRPGTKIIGKTLSADINKQACRVEGSVVLWHSADKSVTDNFRNQDTKINCDILDLKTISKNAEIFMTGHIQLIQKDKQGFADRAQAYELTDVFIFEEHAGIIFERTDWLLTDKTVKKIKQDEARQLVYERLTMRGDRLQISTKTKDVTASGNVSVQVKQKQAFADTAYYDSAREKITLSGNVRLKKADGSVVNAQTVIVDVPTERFEAMGQAESTIILSR